jgi:large repetitive protein
MTLGSKGGTATCPHCGATFPSSAAWLCPVCGAAPIGRVRRRRRYAGVLSRPVVTVAAVGLVVIIVGAAVAVSTRRSPASSPTSFDVAAAVRSAALATVTPPIGPTATPSPSPTATSSPADPLGGKFTSGPPMPGPRYSFVAVALQDGRVFMAGGSGTSAGSAARADIYNPARSLFAETQSMGSARSIESATLLLNGQVLMQGLGNAQGHARAWLYNPATGVYTWTGTMISSRRHYAATLLADGRVLFTGGAKCPGGDETQCVGLTSAEIYNSKTGRFSSTGSMASRRYGHTATLLQDGRVLIAGGRSVASDHSALAGAELYDPATGKVASAGQMVTAREGDTATLLQNGKVLIAGGYALDGDLATAETFDPATSTFSPVGYMTQARQGDTATLLQNGEVLLVGGGDKDSSAELFDPVTGSFSRTGSLPQARQFATATLLPDGRVLVAGGYGAGVTLKSTELYKP